MQSPANYDPLVAQLNGIVDRVNNGVGNSDSTLKSEGMRVDGANGNVGQQSKPVSVNGLDFESALQNSKAFQKIHGKVDALDTKFDHVEKRVENLSQSISDIRRGQEKGFNDIKNLFANSQNWSRVSSNRSTPRSNGRQAGGPVHKMHGENVDVDTGCAENDT
eukprot:2408860-Karenia_brevis.AAC.1